MVSPVVPRASSYRNPYRDPVSRVDVSYAPRDLRRRRTFYETIGVDEMIHGGSRRPYVARSVLVHGSSHGVDVHVCPSLRGRGGRKGGTDVRRAKRIFRAVCCFETDPPLYRDHGLCPDLCLCLYPCPCRDPDDDGKKTCAVARSSPRHPSRKPCYAFGVAGRNHVPSC